MQNINWHTEINAAQKRAIRLKYVHQTVNSLSERQPLQLRTQGYFQKEGAEWVERFKTQQIMQ